MPNPSPGFRRNPDHRITVRPHKGTVTVRIGDDVIASSTHALELKEGSYPPVFYIPFADIKMDKLTSSATSTHCPYKGDASYWSTPQVEDVMWAYQQPYDEMSGIRDHGAFYPNKARIEVK